MSSSAEVAPAPEPSNSAPSSHGRRGVTCRECDRRLPIALAKAGEDPALWECSSCGTLCAGVLLAGSDSDAFARVILSTVHFDARASTPISETIRRLVAELARSNSDYAGDERRRSVRVPQQLEAVVVPLDHDLSLRGDPRAGMVYNISKGGIGLMTSDAITTPHVALRIGTPPFAVQMIGRVVRSRSLRPAIHELGIAFTHRLGRRMPI